MPELGDHESGKGNRAVAAAYTRGFDVARPRRPGDARYCEGAQRCGLTPPRGGAWQSPQIMRLLARLELC